MGMHPFILANQKKIIALAFLDVVSQWEVFVENCFIRYLAGAEFSDGSKPNLRVNNCSSIGHAYQLVTSTFKYNHNTNYLSVNPWKKIEDKAKIFFKDGDPFTSLSSMEKEKLKEATIIRNRVAHYSTKCRSQFADLAKKTLNREKLWGGFSVGDYLIYETNRNFSSQTMQSIYLHYMDLFKKMSKKILKE